MVKEIQNSLIESVMEIWRRRKWLLAGAFVLAFVAAVSLVKALPPLYKASTTVLVGQEDIAESLVTSGRGDQLAQRLEVVQQAILSRARLLEIIEQHDLYPRMRGLVPESALVSRMRKDVFFERGQLPRPGEEGTFPLTISYQSWEPETAAEVANALAALYRQENERLRVTQASSTTAFLKEQLDEARQRMAEKQAQINQFKTEHLGELPEQKDVNMATLERLNNQLAQNGQRQLQLMNLREGRAGDGAAGQPPLPLGASPALQLERLEAEFAEMRKRYTADHPAIIRIQGQIAQLEQQVAEAPDAAAGGEAGSGAPAAEEGLEVADIATQLAQLRRQESELRASIEALQERINLAPTVELQVQQLINEYETVRDEYLSLQERYSTARLSESLQYRQDQQFQVLEPALPPVKADAPAGTQLMLLSFVMSAGFAAGVVFLAEQLDSSFHSPRELRAFTSVPVLASISRIDTAADKWRYALRAGLISLGFVLLLSLAVLLFYKAGQVAGQNLVWMMAGG